MSAPARYGPSLFWQGKTLRIVLTWRDPRCPHPPVEGQTRYDRVSSHAVPGDDNFEYVQTEQPNLCCPDPAYRRALAIERACDIDALGQPIWLPAGAVNAAELLTLLETITQDQLALVRHQPTELPRSGTCATCAHDVGVHFGPHTRCRWAWKEAICPCDEFSPETPSAGGAP